MPLYLASLVVLGVLGLADEKPPSYPRADLLMEPAELNKTDPSKWRVLDARGKGSYNDGHVPGAVWVDHATWMRSFGDGQDRAGWAPRIGKLGIDRDTPVIIYDASDYKDAARIWWILHYWGVKDVRLLNGGWQGWRAAGLPVNKEIPTMASREMKAEPQSSRLATKDQVLQAIKGNQQQILDARSTEEYRGEARTAKRNGSIPTARHFEWSDAIDPKTHRFKSAEELRKLLQDRSIDPSKPCTTYCQSGGRAAVLAFTLELMGGKNVRNYYRSWAEWGNAEDTPIDRPK
jgi:thiosulfate/3-mercaptopyruvate sulfurtransferase